jgi:hypothetical protein
LEINTSGNVGVGASSNGDPLYVSKAGRYSGQGTWYDVAAFVEPTNLKGVSLGYDSSAQLGIIVAQTNAANSGLAFWGYNSGPGWTENMRLDSSGNLGIATKVATEKLVVQGAIRATSNSASFSLGAEAAFMDFVPGSVVRIGHVAGASGSARPLTFYINSSEIARFDAGANLVLGQTSMLSGNSGNGITLNDHAVGSVAINIGISGVLKSNIYQDASQLIVGTYAALSLNLRTNNINALSIDSSQVITDKNGNELGWKNIPTSSQVSGALTNECRGKLVKATGGVTINTSVFADGDTFSIYNTTGSAITITQGTSVTLELAGTATTGSRTLATKGLMTVRCHGTNFSTTGAGVS